MKKKLLRNRIIILKKFIVYFTIEDIKKIPRNLFTKKRIVIFVYAGKRESKDCESMYKFMGKNFTELISIISRITTVTRTCISRIQRQCTVSIWYARFLKIKQNKTKQNIFYIPFGETNKQWAHFVYLFLFFCYLELDGSPEVTSTLFVVRKA